MTSVKKIELLKLAAKARDQRRYAETCKIYLEVLEVFGPDSDVMWALAESEFSLSIVSPDAEDTHGHNALDWIQRAIDLQPNRADYHTLLGGMLEHVGAPNYEEAARAYRRAIELEPYFYPALVNLASLHGVPENVVALEDAISYCERSIKMRPTRSQWIVLARLYRYASRQMESENARINSLLERFEETNIKY